MLEVWHLRSPGAVGVAVHELGLVGMVDVVVVGVVDGTAAVDTAGVLDGSDDDDCPEQVVCIATLSVGLGA